MSDGQAGYAPSRQDAARRHFIVRNEKVRARKTEGRLCQIQQAEISGQNIGIKIRTGIGGCNQTGDATRAQVSNQGPNVFERQVKEDFTAKRCICAREGILGRIYSQEAPMQRGVSLCVEFDYALSHIDTNVGTA